MAEVVDRRRRRTRMRLSQVAVELFIARDYATTSTDEIAAAADVSRSTLFRYVGSKEDLIFGIEDELVGSAPEALRSAPGEPSPWDALRTAVVSVAAQLAGVRRHLLDREQVIATSEALQVRAAARRRHWEQALVEALRERYRTGGTDAELLAKSAVACLEVAEKAWIAEGGKDDLVALVESAFQTMAGLVRPVAPDAGSERPAPAERPGADIPDLAIRAIATASNGISIVDARLPDHPLVHVNEAFLRLTGYTEAEVLGRNCRFLQGPDTDRIEVRRIARLLEAGNEVHSLLLNYRKDGTPFWNQIDIVAVRDRNGDFTHLIGNQMDVTQRVQRQEQLAYGAYHDALTGLANRARLMQHAEDELGRARRYSTGVAVLFVDLDGVRTVYREHGPSVGEAALNHVATRIAAQVHAGDLLARLGPESLVLVLGGLPRGSREPAERAAQQIHDALAEPWSGAGTRLHLGVRIGIATYPDDGDTVAELLDRADPAGRADDVP